MYVMFSTIFGISSELAIIISTFIPMWQLLINYKITINSVLPGTCIFSVIIYQECHILK